MGKGMKAGKKKSGGGGGGNFGGFKSGGNQAAQMKQLQHMQAEMERVQAELDAKEVETTAGGGAVAVKVNGKKEVLSIKIDPDVMDKEDPEMLEDLILVAVNEGLRQSFWLQAMQGGIKGEHDCIKEFSEVDYTEDLKKINKPLLIIQGDDDQIVPINASGERTVKIVKGSQLKVYPGASHGLVFTHRTRLCREIAGFLQGR